jgi:hypothetical protein
MISSLSMPCRYTDVMPRLLWPSWRWMTISGTPSREFDGMGVAEPAAVRVVASGVHDGDDLLHLRGIGRTAKALIARRSTRPALKPGIVAGDRRRPTRSSNSSSMTPPRARDCKPKDRPSRPAASSADAESGLPLKSRSSDEPAVAAALPTCLDAVPSEGLAQTPARHTLRSAGSTCETFAGRRRSCAQRPPVPDDARALSSLDTRAAPLEATRDARPRPGSTMGAARPARTPIRRRAR